MKAPALRLVGMLDSPYVRRVAVSMRMLDIPFRHEAVSVFSTYEAFSAINPVVKAPTLVTDEGIGLMDSTLILEYLERISSTSLLPDDSSEFLLCQRAIGLALAACEKTVQIVYEHDLRPEEKRHRPWIDRVEEQLRQAYRLLEEEVRLASPWMFGSRILQADITAAVAWRFTEAKLPQFSATLTCPRLAALSKKAEALPAFCAFQFD